MLITRNPNHSDNPALVDSQGITVSYSQLWKRIDSLVQLLRSRGAGHGTRIGILQHKTSESAISILAARTIGAVYIPIDGGLPATRIKNIIEDCDPDVLICDPQLLPSDIPCQTDMCSAVPGMENTVITFLSAAHAQREKFAYILYTSGSTGTPKGVCVSEEAANAFVQWGISTFGVKAGDNVSSIAPFHFDLSVFDLFVTLSQGATLHLFRTEEIQNIRAMAEQLAAKKISVIYSTPTFFSTLLHYGKAEKQDWSPLRTVLFAGEVFPVKVLHQLMALWSTARFFNLYGPTETNVCTYTEIAKNELQTTPYPIGLPCEGHEIEIDEHGELLVGGLHVAAGYLNRSELTDARFFTRGNVRWFRTGDCVERNKSGQLIYKGRLDRMVKRRGYRIEPAEIENALSLHPDISSAAVVPITRADGTVNLVAFVTTLSGKAIDIMEVKSFLMKTIPDYMLPDAVKNRDVLPTTSSGKIDYTLLQKEIVSSF